jgi:hypothetical protein
MRPILFRPGHRLGIHLIDYINQIKSIVEPSIPLSVVTQVSVNCGPVFFEDGMQWSGGFKVFDRQNLNWRRMDREYFPGDMNGHWPGRPGWGAKRQQ